MVISSKACKPDNFWLHNSLKLSFRNIWGLHLNFVDCQSFIESNSPDIIFLCETDLDDWIYSGNFSVGGYLPLIRRDSSTHMCGLAVYVKGLPFGHDLSLENSADSDLCFRLTLRHSVSCFFFLYRSPSSCVRTVYDFISSNIDDVLSMNPERSGGNRSMSLKFFPKSSTWVTDKFRLFSATLILIVSPKIKKLLILPKLCSFLLYFIYLFIFFSINVQSYNI